MTSSKHFGDNRSAYEECIRISKELEKIGYFIVRKKIETAPWNISAPSILTEDEQKIANGCYFESHIGIIIEPIEKELLNNFVKNIDYKDIDGLDLLSGVAKLSQNFFKKSKDNNAFVNMLTYRSNKCGRYKFEDEVNYIKKLLTINNFKYEKVEIEYTIYDTNIKHDSKWINIK